MINHGNSIPRFTMFVAFALPLGLGVWAEAPPESEAGIVIDGYEDCRHCFQHDYIIYKEHAFWIMPGEDPWYGGELHNFYLSKLCYNGCRGIHGNCPWLWEDEENDQLLQALFTTSDLVSLLQEHPDTFEYNPTRRIVQIRAEECGETILAHRKVTEAMHIELSSMMP